MAEILTPAEVLTSDYWKMDNDAEMVSPAKAEYLRDFARHAVENHTVNRASTYSLIEGEYLRDDEYAPGTFIELSYEELESREPGEKDAWRNFYNSGKLRGIICNFPLNGRAGEVLLTFKGSVMDKTYEPGPTIPLPILVGKTYLYHDEAFDVRSLLRITSAVVPTID